MHTLLLCVERVLLTKTPFLPVVLCLFLVQPAKAETNPTLAEIGEQKITLKDLQNRILSMPEEAAEDFTKESKEALLLEMVKLEVFTKEALAMGLEKDKEVEARIRGFVNYILASEYLKRQVKDKVNVDEKELLQHFEEHRLEFVDPEKIRTRQVYIRAKTAEEIEKARPKAEKLLGRLKSGEDFASLAIESSDDLFTKEAGGDMGYFARGRLVPELEEHVFSLKVGEISPILRSESGFHIFKLENRMPERLMEYDEVREQIEEDLKAKKEKETYTTLEERLFQKYNVKIYRERITP